MKKRIIVALISLMLFSGWYSQQAFSQTNTSQYAQKPVEVISVKPAQIGKSWKLTNSFYVDQKQLDAFANKFSAKLLSLKNDKFKKGAEGLQINYIQAKTPADADKVFNTLVKSVGNYNVIAEKGNIVVEIISGNILLKKEIINTLKPDKIHKNY